MKKFDVIVIGAGSGGLTVANSLSLAGKKVALIETHLLGGDCTNFGCVPSKALLDISRNNKNISLKDALIETRKRRKFIQDEEKIEDFQKRGIDVYIGNGKIKDKNHIIIDNDKTIFGKNIIIATGSSSVMMDIEGIDSNDILTNKNIFELDNNINDLIIIGGGYIGCEMSEAFFNLGVNVSIIQRNKYLLPKEESETREFIKKYLEEKGVKIYLETSIEKILDKNALLVNKKGEKTSIIFDKILFSIGRKANVDNLGLDNIGLKYDRSGIFVNKYNQTNINNIFAIGDVVSGNPQFTHLANNEGRGVVRNILFPYIKSSYREKTFPMVLYTSIEVARTGKTYEELLENYDKDDIVSHIYYFENNDRSKVTDDKYGFIKINFKKITGKLLGVSIVGKNSGEMISTLTLAIENNISAYKISNLIFPYPTKSEVIKKVYDMFVINTISNLKEDIKYILKKNILQIITLIIWIIIISIYIYFKNKYSLSIDDISINLYNYISGNTIGAILYIFVYTIRPIIFFPATILIFISGVLFGPIYGMIYTLIGENMSANLAYFIGRIFGNRIIKEKSKIGFFNNLSSKTNNKPFLTVLSARLLFVPFDLTNYGSGILKINWKSYFLATFIGTTPGFIIFVLAGSAFHNTEITKISDLLKNINLDLLYIYLV